MKSKLLTIALIGMVFSIKAQENNYTSDLFLKYNYAKISLGKQGADGDVHFGAMGNGVPQNGLQDYGFYAAHNAYRGTDGKWYHSRQNTIPAIAYSGSAGVSSGLNGFHWRYSANNGANAINWTNLMSLTTSGNLSVTGTTTAKAFKTDKTNTDYHHFTRNGGGAAVYINQLSVNKNHPILRLSSGTDKPNTNVKFTVENNGNIGIGVTNPDHKLHINLENKNKFKTYNYGAETTVNTTGGWARSFRLRNENDDKTVTFGAQNGNAFIATNFDISKDAIGYKNQRLTVHSNGNVGIGTGTTTPSEKLEVKEGNIRIHGTNTSRYIRFGEVNYQGAFINYDGTKNLLHIGVNNINTADKANDNNAISIERVNGYVGIGTTDTKGFRLGVKGRVAAEEVKIAKHENWPDFVFENTYNLPSLTEVESHIQTKGHLKNIPSAKEVEKDGFFLGNMDAKLLQKIEELTLYTIQQEKKLTTLQKENEQLKTINKQLLEIQKRLDKLENKN
ncbi:hypothetical protein [Tenacibaculum sp. 190524A02b]|uniref:Peptidase S74 domain-containing protein n=1 Tax=Tenacibaculum vairaonense TaxID=3137860 RepID=A0ABM9PNC0_9FLAO